jgi:hypothetical protein
MSWGSNTRKFGVCALPLLVVLLHAVSSSAQAPSGPGKVFRRLLAPFRSNPFLVDSSRPCGLGFATCFLPSDSSQPRKPAASAFAPASFIADPTRVVALELRTQHRGPFCHHWLQIESSHGQVTLGYGPATVPFIDAGQISLQDGFGNIERISGMHPIPMMGLPPLSYRYAKAPGSGHLIGKPIQLTLAQSDALIGKEREHKFVGPYIPIFHDCRTYTCKVQASAKGQSSLPCYLLFKGYW